MGRKRRIGMLVAALCMTSCGEPPAAAPARKPTLKAAAVVAPPTTEEIIASLMPSVVLLLATHADGTVMYGSGIIVSGDGLVVTNHHVIANAIKLEALLYDPKRPTYTPMDGGVGRYMKENALAMVTAVVAKDDVPEDLAIVRVKADTVDAPMFHASRDELKLGQRIIALGHPQEGLWSYTAGEVSALRSGMIQHDALIGQGSSGGPLINARGELVGVNTAVIESDRRGLSFARPVSMVVALLDASESPLQNDDATPEHAALTGWRLADLGSAATPDLSDWENLWRVRRAGIADFEASGLSPDDAKTLVAKADAPGAREPWIEDARTRWIKRLREPIASCDTLKAAEDKALSARAKAVIQKVRAAEREANKAIFPFTNLRVNLYDACDTAGFHAAMRLGLRVDRATQVTPDVAWVVLAGRNLDKTPFTFTELYVRDGTHWRQRSYPSKEEIALIPHGWPPPLETFDRERLREFAGFVSKYVK